jgi:hypothetical protein
VNDPVVKRGNRGDCFRKSRNESGTPGGKRPRSLKLVFACGKTDKHKAWQIPTMAI